MFTVICALSDLLPIADLRVGMILHSVCMLVITANLISLLSAYLYGLSRGWVEW